MKIRSAVPENGCLIFCGGQKKQEKNRKKNKKNICKTYTHPPHGRLRNQSSNKAKQVQINDTILTDLIRNAQVPDGQKTSKFRRDV